MADLQLLHSGIFNDYDGNIIKVSFYKKTDINAYPTPLHFGAGGGSQVLAIWSRDGDACLGDPYEEWWNYRQIRAEKIVGTDWYRYYYYIDVEPNEGYSAREANINVYNDAGEMARMVVPLIQDGQE